MLVLALALVMWGWFAWRVRRSPGRASNGTTLIIALFLTWLGLVLTLEALGQVELAKVVGVGAIFAGPFAVVIASVWLIVNGLIVVRKEGLRTSTALPLVFGGASLLALAFPFAMSAIFDNPQAPLWTTVLIWMVLLFYIYLGFHLLAYTTYAMTYSKLPRVQDIDAIVMLGCGLSRGYSVTPLLAGRLRQGLTVYTDERDSGRTPVMVTSGGQGPDEKRPEAEAMAEWLAEQGVVRDQILIEDRSRTTEENLLFSRELLADRAPKTVVVATSNYHVLRTASLVRKLGLNWRVVGAPTASYYTPTAFLREFIAHLTYGWKRHAAVAALIIALLLALWAISSYSGSFTA